MKTFLGLALILITLTGFGQTISGKTNAVAVDYTQAKAAENKPPVHKFMALIIGVSKYQYQGAGLSSLDNPVKDAQTIYETLIAHYTFEKEDIIFLTDPTRQQIIDGFERISNEATENDNVLVFYAGHGVWERQKDLGYWLPSDARLESKSDWIANSQIKDYLSDNVIKSKHTLLITDACFSGSIFKSRGVSGDMAVRISELYREPSRTAMTSGNLSTVPDRSIFIQQLVKKLSENQEELLPARQLFSRIYEPIINNSSTNPVYGVIQGAGDGGGDFIFIKRK